MQVHLNYCTNEKSHIRLVNVYKIAQVRSVSKIIWVIHNWKILKPLYFHLYSHILAVAFTLIFDSRNSMIHDDYIAVVGNMFPRCKWAPSLIHRLAESRQTFPELCFFLQRSTRPWGHCLYPQTPQTTSLFHERNNI